MKVGAMVILYNPDLEQAENLILCLRPQVDTLIVLDNSPQKTQLRANDTRFYYEHFGDNLGLAKAQNIGLKKLRSEACHLGLIFDQDSRIGDDYVNAMQSLMHKYMAHENIIAIGPQIVCSFSHTSVHPSVQKQKAVNHELSLSNQIIASGMMIRLTELDSVGFKDEALFIDGVDHEWCWRARQQNYQIAIARKIKMIHQLGDERVSLFGVRFKVGAPIRLYYQFRNILILSRRTYVPSYWKCRNLLLMPIRFLVNSIFLAQKRKRVYFMLKGFYHGLKGKSGRLD